MWRNLHIAAYFSIQKNSSYLVCRERRNQHLKNQNDSYLTGIYYFHLERNFMRAVICQRTFIIWLKPWGKSPCLCLYLMPVSTVEELVSSGCNHFYLLQLPYNLHLWSENEPSLPEFGKLKFSLVFRGWDWVYRGAWTPLIPSFPLTFLPRLVIWRQKPSSLAFSAGEGNWACLSPVGKFLSSFFF